MMLEEKIEKDQGEKTMRMTEDPIEIDTTRYTKTGETSSRSQGTMIIDIP